MTTEDLMRLADKFAFFMPGSEEGEQARQALLDALEALGREVDALKQQAQIWKMEAETQKATVHEIYQLCTGATGEPGDWNGAAPVREVIAERDTIRAKLAALQVDDELPEPVVIDRHIPTNIVIRGYTADQLRQHAAQVRAKMVPLEKDAARYRWWCDTGNDILAKDTIGGKPTIDAAIDAAMGITGEPK